MFRRIAIALAAPLLLVTACATEAEPDASQVQPAPAALAMVRAAPDAVASVGTVAFEITVVGGDQLLGLTAHGMVDAAAGRLSMELDVGDALGDGEPVQVIIDGTTWYVRAPMLEGVIGTPGWSSGTVDDLGWASDAFAYDPSTLLDALGRVAGDVTAVGHEEVRGVATTKYAATVRSTDAHSNAPDQPGDGALPVEVWLDADGLPRRIAFTVGDGLRAHGSGAATTMRLEMFDYGHPVAIDVPPSAEVTPFADLLGGLGEAWLGAGT